MDKNMDKNKESKKEDIINLGDIEDKLKMNDYLYSFDSVVKKNNEVEGVRCYHKGSIVKAYLVDEKNKKIIFENISDNPDRLEMSYDYFMNLHEIR